MANKFRTVGTPPGTLQYLGPQQHASVKITLIQFSEHEFHEKEFSSFEECLRETDPKLMHWINIEGVHQTEIVDAVGRHFQIHPLTLEDIVHVDQRPKFEEYENYLLVIMKMMCYEKKVIAEQLSLILVDNTVLTFQEPAGADAFDIIRLRLRQAKGRVRKQKVDYLLYALMDAVVDYYFQVLEKIGDQISQVEEEIIREPKRQSLIRLYQLKREVVYLRKQVWPVRDMVGNLLRSESQFIGPGTELFFRDLQDHSTRIIETVEVYRDLLSGIMDIHLSTNANKMNEVMKVLTVMSSIFIPVTFIAGIYGMNFEYMPELKTPYGYGLVWVVMLLVMGGLFFYFKKKKWI